MYTLDKGDGRAHLVKGHRSNGSGCVLPHARQQLLQGLCCPWHVTSQLLHHLIRVGRLSFRTPEAAAGLLFFGALPMYLPSSLLQPTASRIVAQARPKLVHLL